MTEQEKLLKAKIPCEETGIEIKHSICDICTPGAQCGLDVYVKDGVILKVEGTDGFPGSNGKLCTKGASNRQHVYRKNRIKHPMKRMEDGSYENITWDQAYKEISEKLNQIKKESGPESVAWFTGYSKWFRPWLHRITHSFGSLNYGTESSTCFQSTAMAWKTITGREYKTDLKNAGVFMGWGCNTMINSYIPARGLRAFKERGGKVIIIDPRITHTAQKLADLHLQLRPGTDGALALGMANLMIQRGLINQDFIDRYVHGFEEYKAYVQQFTLEETERITGVPAELIEQAVIMYTSNLPGTGYLPSATITHHLNGYNNMRAIISLFVLTGDIDKDGGLLPSHSSYIYTDCGFDTMEDHFVYDKKPSGCREKIGQKRFPVWSELVHEFQANDLVRQIHEQDPYPIRALMAFGMNYKMFPRSEAMLAAIDKLDLVVATEICETEVCRHAHYVLPVCTSLERSELKGYAGGFLTCTTPAVPPLYESKCDPEIICDLASWLDLDDDLLKSGYENTMRYMISNLSVTLEELKEAPLPVKVKELRPYKAGTYLENGFETPTGKIELFSERIASIAKERPDLSPLPVYKDSFDESSPEEYPFTLIAGSRLPNAIHSRLHELSWPRHMRPEAAADIHPEDAAKLGIKEGDSISLSTTAGSICVLAHLTASILPGDVYMYHGYSEANVNSIIGINHLDPYSGFPGYRQIRCSIRKAGN